MKYEDVIKGAYQHIAKQHFSIKQKCSQCRGAGSVADYSTLPYGSTSAVPRKPCDKCGGSGEVYPW